VATTTSSTPHLDHAAVTNLKTELIDALKEPFSEATRVISGKADALDAKLSALDNKLTALHRKFVEVEALEAVTLSITENFRQELGTRLSKVEMTIVEQFQREIRSRLHTVETELMEHSRRELAASLRATETNITDKVNAQLGTALAASEATLDSKFQAQLDDGLKSLGTTLILSLAPHRPTTTPIIDQIKKKQSELTALTDVQKEATDAANNEKDETIRDQWEAIAKRVGQLAEVARTELGALTY
jgi:hypothetical protein